MVSTDAASGQKQSRAFAYNPIGFLTSRTEPETGLTLFRDLDRQGRAWTVEEDKGADGQTRLLALRYDGLGRLRSKTGGSDLETFTYSGTLLTNATSSCPSGMVSQSYAYANPGAALSSEITVAPLAGAATATSTIGYLTDDEGHLRTLTYPDGRRVDYAYSNGRVSGVSVDGKSLASAGYDGWGHLGSLTFASGTQDAWAYTEVDAKLRAWTFTPGGDAPEPRAYAYDGNLNLTAVAPDWSALAHDAKGQLLSATGFGFSDTFTHDGFGNNTSSSMTSQGLWPTTVNPFNLAKAYAPLVDNRIPGFDAQGAYTGWATNARGEAWSLGVAAGGAQALNLTWDGLGRLSGVSGDVPRQSHLYAPSGMRVGLDDATDPSRSRRYAYTGGGRLLSEAGPASPAHGGSKAVQVFHLNDSPSAMSRAMGSFAAGDQVTVSVWFKAAPGVSGALGIHDGKPTDLNDNKQFLSMAGNGAWQQLTFTHVMTRADALWVDLYGDQFTATSASATAATSVTYDDVQVTSVQRGPVMKEGFESGLALGTDPSSETTWYSCGEPTQLASASGAPSQWMRDVIYLGDLAIAEIDTDGVHELHSDHLGTPRIITRGSDGRVEGRQAYAAFGERIDQPTYTSGYRALTGYTGHIQTDATGLIYMRGRFYSPAWHRFLNSDHGADPNQAHQFAYAHGSPLKLTDYSGFAAGGSAQVGVGDPLADEKEKERARANQGTFSKILSGIKNGVKAFNNWTERNENQGRGLGRITHAERPKVLAEMAKTDPLRAAFTIGMIHTESYAMGITSGLAPVGGAAGIEAVIAETITGKGNITSTTTLTSGQLLEAGERFVGPGAQEIGKAGSGVYRSIDGTRQFRIDENSLLGSHAPGVPHGHLEIYSPGTARPLVNNHIPFIE